MSEYKQMWKDKLTNMWNVVDETIKLHQLHSVAYDLENDFFNNLISRYVSILRTQEEIYNVFYSNGVDLKTLNILDDKTTYKTELGNDPVYFYDIDELIDLPKDEFEIQSAFEYSTMNISNNPDLRSNISDTFYNKYNTKKSEINSGTIFIQHHNPYNPECEYDPLAPEPEPEDPPNPPCTCPHLLDEKLENHEIEDKLNDIRDYYNKNFTFDFLRDENLLDEIITNLENLQEAVDNYDGLKNEDKFYISVDLKQEFDYLLQFFKDVRDNVIQGAEISFSLNIFDDIKNFYQNMIEFTGSNYNTATTQEEFQQDFLTPLTDIKNNTFKDNIFEKTENGISLGNFHDKINELRTHLSYGFNTNENHEYWKFLFVYIEHYIGKYNGLLNKEISLKDLVDEKQQESKDLEEGNIDIFSLSDPEYPLQLLNPRVIVLNVVSYMNGEGQKRLRIDYGWTAVAGATSYKIKLNAKGYSEQGEEPTNIIIDYEKTYGDLEGDFKIDDDENVVVPRIIKTVDYFISPLSEGFKYFIVDFEVQGFYKNIELQNYDFGTESDIILLNDYSSNIITKEVNTGTE